MYGSVLGEDGATPSTPIAASTRAVPVQDRPSRKRLRVVGAIAVTAVAAAAALAAVESSRAGGLQAALSATVPMRGDTDASSAGPPSGRNGDGSPASARGSTGVVLPSVGMEFSDRYTAKLGPYFSNYTFMRDYDALVAAYQETAMEVSFDDSCDGDGDGDGSPCTYTWTVDGSELQGATGRNATFTFKQLKHYVVEVSSSGGASASYHVLSRYVRHEIRELFDDDRERYFKAVETVFSVRKADGQALYGSGYVDAGHFINYHTSLAGARACDHLHDGMGFLTGHNAISNEFEINLQRVDPRVHVPYWDYTRDMHRVHVAGGDDMSAFYDSVVFRDDWFGPMGDAQAGYAVTRGAVSSLVTVDPAAWELNASEVFTTNGYGMLRSPWNVAKDPHLIRANVTMGYYTSYIASPRCAEFYTAMNYSDILDFTRFAQSNAHGAIHTIIGGVSNVDWKGWFRDLNFTRGEEIGLQGFGIVKRLWRSGKMQCPSACAADTPLAECGCTCPGLANWDDDTLTEAFRDAAGAFNESMWYMDGEDRRRDFMSLFCGEVEGSAAPVLGDAMNSGATADPSFYPTHPNIDRLFQHRMMAGMTGTDYWPDGDRNDPRFYWGGGHGTGRGCWGHQPDNTMIWKGLFVSDVASEHLYTVKELWDRMDPNRGENRYVYDNFRWEHCAAEGYPADLRDVGTVNDDAAGSWSDE